MFAFIKCIFTKGGEKTRPACLTKKIDATWVARNSEQRRSWWRLSKKITQEATVLLRAYIVGAARGLSHLEIGGLGRVDRHMSFERLVVPEEGVAERG